MGRALIPYAIESNGTAPLNLKPGPQHVAVDRIIPRPSEPTRRLRAIHVLAVAESIAALGLLEPPILDTQGRILAGAHRLAALQLLSSKDAASLRSRFLGNCDFHGDNDPGDKTELAKLLKRVDEISPKGFHARYPGGKVPVHVIDVSKEKTNFLALSIETAENSIRRQYTPDEVQGLFGTLIKAGFTHKNGRPKGDEKTVVDALKGILGKSDSQVRRMLKGEAKLETPEWQRVVASFVRAALRVRRVSDAGKERGSDAKDIMQAVETLLGTPTGRRIRRHQPGGRKTHPSD